MNAENVFPLRLEWEMTQPKQREAFPGPLRTSRSAQNGLVLPTATLKLSEYARELSWDVRVQASTGHMPHARTGRPGALKELIGLVFGNHPMTDRQAYAVYSRNVSGGAWTWSSVMIWGPQLKPYAGCGITELKEYLAKPSADAVDVHLWVAGLKAIAESTEEAGKRRLRIRAQIAKVASEGRFEAARQESRKEWFTIDAAWREKVADLADGVFTSEEVTKILEPKKSVEGMR